MLHEVISFAVANPLVIILSVYAIQIITIFYLWATDRRIGALIDVIIMAIRIVLNLIGVSI